MRNLENLGVQELNTKEMKDINGGFLGILLVVSLIIVAGIFANDDNDRTRTYVDGKRVGR
jgi:lactobin A/cerein 7B family class IIb bacteriocin